MSCELCRQPAGDLLYQNDKLWLVLVDEPGYPASAAWSGRPTSRR